jgi:hypothetical protein
VTTPHLQLGAVTSSGCNLVPGKYRGVSVASVDCPLHVDGLRGHFLGREAYRHTRFIVVRRGPQTALVTVRKASDIPLFSPIVELELLAGPQHCAYLQRPETDTAVPSMLAAAALEGAPGAKAVVVQGRYSHVNFIYDPRPLRIVVREVVPPRPAKLFDQAQRVVAVAEDLPPIQLVPEFVDLAQLARNHPAEHYLLPCRGSGGDVPGARVSYLDERPERADWTLLGCARSREIHRWFYGDDPPVVDFCPRAVGPGAVGGLLTKCCLQEHHLEQGIEPDHAWVSLPWGSTLEQVREGLAQLAHHLEPSWAPD